MAHFDHPYRRHISNNGLFLHSGLQHIEQDERVSMSLNGDLYFSHAVEKDSRRDYCCFAAFPRIRTIVQKTAMSVIVKTSGCRSSFFVFTRMLFSLKAAWWTLWFVFRALFISNMLTDVHVRGYTPKAIPSATMCYLCASPWIYVVILISLTFFI